MQPKFTKRKVLMLLQKTLSLFLVGIASFVNAQTISTTSGTNYLGNLSINNTNPLNVSFVIQNTTGAAVALTSVSTHMAPFTGVSNAGDASVTKLFVSSTSLSGIYDYSTAAWTQIASGNAVVPAALSFVPVISGINYIIPAGAQLRFVLELSKGLRISSNLAGDPMPTPNVFSSGGINLQLGNFQIAGQNVGFGGVAPTAPAGNTPVFFGGSVTLNSTVPCSGTPTPGATLPATSAVCPGITFNLSLANATTGSGVTYQWQSGTSATGPWTDINLATNSTYSGTITATTYYQCKVTCSGNTGTSTPAVVNLNPPSSCYCTPAATNCTLDDEILNVTFGTLNNSSSGCSGVGYSDYTALPAPVVYSGGGNPISVTIGPGGGDGICLWIDYNKNGNFEVSEYTLLGSISTGTLNGTINIPTTALTGPTRMRVRVRFGAAFTNVQPCTGGGFAETEDYTVDIQPCVPVTVTSSPASTSVLCGSSASFTAAVAGSLQSVSWEYRTNSSAAWQVLNNGGIYSGANTLTLNLSEVSAAISGYQYRALVTGICSAIDFTQAATLTVNPLVPVVNPASATICLGAVQSLTLTNTLGNSNLISEGFNVASPLPAGWFAQNNSSPVGTTGWFQGNPATFPSFSGAADSYIGANFNNTTGDNTISNWLLTPAIGMKNGDVFSFYTRTVSAPAFADRLEVRLSSNGASTNVGTTNVSVGDFTTVLLTVNPTLITSGTGSYPNTWTKFTVTISGLAAPATGRIGFRYFVTSGGPAGANSDFIGIDDVVYTSTGGPAQGVWTGPAGTMFTNAGATTAYTGTPATVIYVKPTVTSNYSVIYTTPTPCTSSSTTVPVTVNVPIAGLAVAPATRAVCVGGSTTFTASVTGGNPVTYQWQQSVDGGLVYTNISGATSSTLTISGVTATMTGYKYRVVATGGVCGAVTSATIGTITVNALPVVTLSSTDLQIIPGQTTSINATSTPAAQATNSWVWSYNGASITTATTNNTSVLSGIDVDELGSYVATVTDVNGCVNSSAAIVVGAEANDKLWIYPNPTTGNFYVRLYFGGELTETRKVSIYNPTGQLLESREITLQDNANPYQRMDFNLGGVIAKGSYVVKVAHKVSGKVISGILLVQ